MNVYYRFDIGLVRRVISVINNLCDAIIYTPVRITAKISNKGFILRYKSTNMSVSLKRLIMLRSPQIQMVQPCIVSLCSDLFAISLFYFIMYCKSMFRIICNFIIFRTIRGVLLYHIRNTLCF